MHLSNFIHYGMKPSKHKSSYISNYLVAWRYKDLNMYNEPQLKVYSLIYNLYYARITLVDLSEYKFLRIHNFLTIWRNSSSNYAELSIYSHIYWLNRATKKLQFIAKT